MPIFLALSSLRSRSRVIAYGDSPSGHRSGPQAILRNADFLTRQPRSLPDGLLDILAIEIWITLENLFAGRSVCDLTNDDRNRDSETTETGAATHDLRIESNAIEHALTPTGRVHRNGSGGQRNPLYTLRRPPKNLPIVIYRNSQRDPPSITARFRRAPSESGFNRSAVRYSRSARSRWLRR